MNNLDLFELLRDEDNDRVYREDFQRIVNEMSDNISAAEMRVILDQTFSTFGLGQADSMSEELFIKVYVGEEFTFNPSDYEICV